MMHGGGWVGSLMSLAAAADTGQQMSIMYGRKLSIQLLMMVMMMQL